MKRAESSMSRVTITLGNSRQVVKRSLDSAFSDSQPAVGSKRSVLDRLGSSTSSATQFSNKRKRDDDATSIRTTLDDAHLRKDDLRFKIMRKNVLKESQSNCQQNGVDLRSMLSRPAQSSTNSVTREHVPEQNDTRQLYSEPRNSRQNVPGGRDGKQHMPELRNGRHYVPESRDGRHHMPDSRDGRLHMHALRDGREHMPEPRARQPMLQSGDGSDPLPEPSSTSILGRGPSTRAADVYSQTDTYRSPYSTWTLDNLRRRSPDGVVGTSRGYSPPRREGDLQRRPSMRTYDDARAGSYVSKDLFDVSRPTTTASYMPKAALPAASTKTAAPLHAPPPPNPGSLVQRSLYAVDNQISVDVFLRSLGLDKYAILFKAEEVDMYTLRQMGDTDLKELGIPMGPRKKILLALISRYKRQA